MSCAPFLYPLPLAISHHKLYSILFYEQNQVNLIAQSHYIAYRLDSRGKKTL